MEKPALLGLIAGNGVYPQMVAQRARLAGVQRIVAAAFTSETDPALAALVDKVEWLRAGQLGRLLKFFKSQGVRQAIMAGQIAPANLFDLRPDMKALLLLSRLERRNAESIFAAIAAELADDGIILLPATTFLERELATLGLMSGRPLKRRQRADVEFGLGVAREISRLDIGQTVVVKNGSVLAVEAFEGTDAAIRRGGALGQGGAVVVKVAKPNQDMRFDVPVVGVATVTAAAEAGVSAIALETDRTLLLPRNETLAAADAHGITVLGT
jgi:DUF1009 family protein